MTPAEYVSHISHVYQTQKATEHSYRGDLASFIAARGDVRVTNEPKRQACGAPDYIVERGDVPIGYIEAKDIGVDLDAIEKSEQLKRYLSSLTNLILTDYLEFRFFREGEKVETVRIATVDKKKVVPCGDAFETFERRIASFLAFRGQTITTSEQLAGMMAQKARMMEEVLYRAVREDDEDNTLREQLAAFRKILIHDLDERTFADIYAQTIAYGFFAARLNDKTLEDFSRQEALFLIPKSNPFLMKLFSYVAGPDLDTRVTWIVNDLADIFRATDLGSIMADFGKATAQNDPFLHFYETFLANYDARLRKSRGVYYTPEPVVDFIVRAVDEILVRDFGLEAGLADTSKTTIEVDDKNVKDGRTKSGFAKKKVELHRVQILDPATGTGTFLARVVKHIHERLAGQQGMWSAYVEEHLLPRLHGFEVLMASYTMCHLKLEMLLQETGYVPRDANKRKRLRVFLTNSLEEAHPDAGTLFASWLAKEANEANFVKDELPVMVVLGNPPYSVSSMNKSEWIQSLITEYKKGLNEKKINLDDDYIKFIRYGEHFIDKNGEGVLAYISNNSFLDGVTHRQMRKHLLETFDTIYIIDLHGSSKKRETASDGSKDENVFDIQQGVSINIFVKKGAKRNGTLADVYHYDLFGRRSFKSDYLVSNTLDTVAYTRIHYSSPYYFFVPKDFSKEASYEKGFALNVLFGNYNSGIETAKDKVVIQFSKKEIDKIHQDFLNKDSDSLIFNYGISKDKIRQIAEDLVQNHVSITQILYRPFDYRYVIYTDRSQGVLWRPRHKTSRHLIEKANVGLLFKRGFDDSNAAPIHVTSKAIDRRSWSRPGSNGADFLAPLYLYPEDGQQTFDGNGERKPNLNMKIVAAIAEKLGLRFTPEKTKSKKSFAPIDLLDYIYAVLHSPAYREKYKEFLKIDFPRVPYPEDVTTFRTLVALGSELRAFHLLEHPALSSPITSYPVEGDNVVEKPLYKGGKVYINKVQYFDGVPDVAWTFYIGGYQPAQKWLKDRKGRALSFNDVMHYQRVVKALVETARIMREIDDVLNV